MVGWLNNPVLNPFYQTAADREADRLAAQDAHGTAENRGSADSPRENKTDPYVNEDSATDSTSITSDYQDGLKKAEAVTMTWSKWSLIGAYVL